MNEDKVYTLDDFPDDAEVFTGQNQTFDPIDPSEMYQLEVSKVELRDNKFYKPEEKDPAKRGQKYQFSFEYVIITEGPFYGRLMWDTTSLTFKPDGRKGPTKLYKILMAILKQNFSWEECQAYAPDTKTFYKNLLDNVVGKQVKVAIENTTNPESKKVRTKIVTYYPVKENLPAFDVLHYDELRKNKKAEDKNVEGNDKSEDDLPF